MTYDARKICPLYAWRGSCGKRFSREKGAAMHCPDFSEDVLLRRQAETDRKNPYQKD